MGHRGVVHAMRELVDDDITSCVNVISSSALKKELGAAEIAVF